MRPDLHNDITQRLTADYGFKAKGDWLQAGKCPECSQKEMFAKAEAPWLLKCGRRDNCGAEFHIKDLYRDLFESWSDRYQATEADPTAAADAYLQSARGFPLKRLHGLYTQEHYHNRELNQGSATVRFPLACGSWWERIIDRPERFGKRKANFAYGKPYHGHWWAMPDTAADAEEIWMAEGVFDAISLELAGKSARALLSCNNYPHAEFKALADAYRAEGRDRPTLVWALDDGKAGTEYMRKWHDRARQEGWDSRAAYLENRGRAKLDWNDAWARGLLDDKLLDAAGYNGSLLLAESASAKALLIYNRRARPEFHFGFGGRLFWFRLDDSRYAKAREALESKDEGLSEAEIREQALLESGGVVEIANCYPSPLYYQANALTDEAWYYFRVEFPHRAAPLKNTFTAGQLTSSAEFKKRLMHIAPGAVFTGSTQQLDRIFRQTLFAIKTVDTVDFIGYSRDHGAWILGDLAVKGGHIHQQNDEDFFELGKISVKSLNQSLALEINRDRNAYRTDWLEMVWQCFGAKGIVALAYWFGGLFAEQLRQADKSFPFLEVVGEAGAGKTTLIEFLWKLVGRRDYEGFDPSKSTLAARSRNFAQVSGLPVVLIEGDRDEDSRKGFDWNELKPLYNGRSVRARGLKNSGNETYEPPFRAALVIAQNAPVQADDAVLQRIVHLSFDKSGHTAATKPLAEELERMPIEQVSGFILAATRREARILEICNERRPLYEAQLLTMPELKSVRLAKNHAQMMALVDALRLVVKLTDDQHEAAHKLLVTMAIERQQAINDDHPHVQAFWELFEHIDGKLNDESLNHSRDPELIAISLVEFEERLAKRGLRLPADGPELKRRLKTSRVRRFVDVKTVNSSITNGSKKCWVFRHAAGP